MLVENGTRRGAAPHSIVLSESVRVIWRFKFSIPMASLWKTWRSTFKCSVMRSSLALPLKQCCWLANAATFRFDVIAKANRRPFRLGKMEGSIARLSNVIFRGSRSKVPCALMFGNRIEQSIANAHRLRASHAGAHRLRRPLKGRHHCFSGTT